MADQTPTMPAHKPKKKPAKKAAAKKPAKKAAAKKPAKKAMAKAMAKKPAKKMKATKAIKAKKPARRGGGGYRRLAGDIGRVSPLKYRCPKGHYEVTLRMIPEGILKCPYDGLDLLRID